MEVTLRVPGLWSPHESSQLDAYKETKKEANFLSTKKEDDFMN